MAVKAIAKGVRLSPRKVSAVSALVRNRTVSDALIILSNVPRRAALPVKKVIISAQANADHNHQYKPDTLRIVQITVTAGPRLKRFRPVARGMAHPYQHRTSHIYVELDGEKRQPKQSQAKAEKSVKETK